MIEEHYGIQLSSFELPRHQVKPWEAEIRAVLAQIARAQSGQIVLNTLRWYIREHKATLQLWPWRGTNQNANTSSWQDETPRAVHIQYSASTWGRNLQDEILFHELVHAVRHASGKHRKCEADGTCRFGGALRDFTNREELIAVLVENIYRSDPSRVGRRVHLRASHAVMGRMEGDLASSFRFFSAGHRVFPIVREFCKDNPVLTELLAKVPSSFNPIAAYGKDPDRAFRASLGSDRDARAYESDFFGEIDMRRYERSRAVEKELTDGGGS